jgi:signal transduction histidine kinase
MYSTKENILIVSLIMLILLIVLVFLFLYYYIKQSRKNQFLLLTTQITSRENEAAKISANLHDDLGPLMASVKIYANSIHTSDNENVEYIKQINHNIDACIATIKTISSNLRPPNFEALGLYKALKLFIDQINVQSQLKIHYTLEDNLPTLSEIYEIHIYRIMLEVMTNTLKHAKATSLEINIYNQNNNLIIETQDNGIGMKVEEITEGNGLKNIKQRVQAMQGKLDFKSQIQKGVYLKIAIQISN